MGFLNKLFDLLLGRNKKPPNINGDKCLVSISMRKYPKRKDWLVTYHIMLNEETKKIYITPNTNSKLINNAIEKANKMAQDTETKRLDNISIGIIQSHMGAYLYQVFEEVPIFKDKNTKLIYYEEE
jgi:hypothetical protein